MKFLLYLVEEQEIIELEKRYWQLKSVSKNGKYDFNLFKNYTSPPLPDQFVKRMFFTPDFDLLA